MRLTTFLISHFEAAMQFNTASDTLPDVGGSYNKVASQDENFLTYEDALQEEAFLDDEAAILGGIVVQY